VTAPQLPWDDPTRDILADIRDTAARERDAWPQHWAPVPAACGWWVGPVWKTGGETCVCVEPAGHDMPHRCTCGAWFEGCGHPPVLRAGS
jgi:hypothetical protein